MKTADEINDYATLFNEKLLSDKTIIRNFELCEENRVGSIYLHDKEHDINIYCDPFWDYLEGGNEEHNLITIILYINDGYNDIFTPHFPFVKTWEPEKDVTTFISILESYIDKFYEYDCMRLMEMEK